jgi:hypothetical protein
VLGNLVVLLALATPTLVLAVLAENERRKDGLAEWASDELIIMSWNFPGNLTQMHIFAKVLFGASFFVFALGVLESIRFYLTYDFEVSEAEHHWDTPQSNTSFSASRASIALSSTRTGVRSNAAFKFVCEAVLPTDAVIHITFPLLYQLAPRKALGKEVRPVGMDGVLKVLSCNASEIVFQRRNATNEVPALHRVSFALPCRVLRNPTVAGAGSPCTDIVGLTLKVSADNQPNLPPAGYIEIGRVTSTTCTARLIVKKDQGYVREVQLAEDNDDNKSHHLIDLDRKHASLLCKSGIKNAITDIKMSYSANQDDAEWNVSIGTANLSVKDKSGTSGVNGKTLTLALHARYGGVLLSARSTVSAKHVIQEHAIECPTIQPGKLANVAATPHSWWPATLTSATITFRLGNELPPGGVIDIDLPSTHKIKYKNVVGTAQQSRKEFYEELNGKSIVLEHKSKWDMSRFLGFSSTKKKSAAPFVTEDGMEVEYNIQVPLDADTSDASTHILLERTFKGESAIPQGTTIRITLPPAFFKNPPWLKARKKHRRPCSIHTKTSRSGDIIDEAIGVHFGHSSVLTHGLLFRSIFLGAVLVLVFMLSSFYLSLVTIWLMLGAVLNPVAYLPYAAAMSTFVSYSYGNIKAFRVRFKDVQKRLMSKVNSHLEQKLQANLVNLELGETCKAAGMVGLLAELHDVNYHVDAVVASKLASCEAAAIGALADRQGIPASMILLTVAIFRHDKDATAKALAGFVMPRALRVAVDKSSVAETALRELIPAMYRFMAFMGNSLELDSYEQQAAITEIFNITGWKSGKCTLEAKLLISKAKRQLKACKLAPIVRQAIEKLTKELELPQHEEPADNVKNDTVATRKDAARGDKDASGTTSTSERSKKLKHDRLEREEEMKKAKQAAGNAMKALAEAVAIDKGVSPKRKVLDDLLLAAVSALAKGETGKFMLYLHTETPLSPAQEHLLRRIAETRAPAKQQAAVQGLANNPTALATISLDRIFSVVDQDSSGYIDPTEFVQALRAMGVTITDERALQIFSRCDKDHSGLLDPREFAQAVEKLQKDVVRHLMHAMGLGRLRSTIILILLIATILGILVFIYLGVEAFGTGGEFAAVINSLLPISTGLFMGFAQKIGWVDVDQILHHLVSGRRSECLVAFFAFPYNACLRFHQEQKIEDALRTQAAGI